VTAYPVEAPLAAAVKAALEAQIGAGLVGDGVKPASGGASTVSGVTTFTAYAVLYAGQASSVDGPADAGSFDARQGWQVTYVGATAAQANALRDEGRGKLLTTRLAPSGRACGPTELADSQPVQRDDDVKPSLYFAVDRYTVPTYPA
jgi:hypothetical protein